MTVSTSSSPDTAERTRRSSTYRTQIPLIMGAAFILSVAHTVYSRLAGIEDPGFTITTPLAWGFYAVAFAVTALARRDARWAQLVVVGFLVVFLLIGVFYYPTMFGPEQQTVFGWFENDVYLGLLGIALYLGIQRLRGVALV
jgi:drug/metabolite transporter (DMT)-like permease